MLFLKNKTEPRLSIEEERSLAFKIQQKGDVKARHRLVLANLGLVYFVVNQMHRPSLRREDLLQEGVLGLMRASESFEANRQLRFSTYAVFWIRAKIQQFIYGQEKDRHWQLTSFSMEVLPSENENPEEQLLRHEKCSSVRKILNGLVAELKNPKLRTIIEYRLLAEEPESLEKVGQRLSISRETCRLLESKMLNLMREQLANWHS